MYTQAESLSRLTDGSLTDVILALCASGHFGVREAIAAATRQKPRRPEADFFDVSTTGPRIPETWHRQDRDLLATPARYASPQEHDYAYYYCSAHRSWQSAATE
jgi:hypothetical protein